MNLILIIIIVLFHSRFILGQSVPADHFLYQSRKLLYDAGEDWQSLTIFGPIRYNSKPEKELKTTESSNYLNGQLGFDAGNNFYSFYGSMYFKYKSCYYGYLYPVFKNRTDINYNNEVRSHSIDNQSGVGYENSWAILQIGRGKESWGSGNDIQLALSENSGTYDYFLLASDYGKIRVRYIYGFLGNVKSNINRYITARGFEWTNKKSLIIGFSETAIYSGENRAFDLGYLNPISSHLEIELNDRLNFTGDSNSNAVWQIHIDYLFKKQYFRISFNYLYDEFVFDPDIQIGKEHGKAYSIRLAYTSLFSNNHILTLFSSFIYVGTPTFRHGIGTNNFVQSGRPLGWHRGSDGQEFRIGMKYFNKKNLILNISTGFLQSGEETTIDNIFETYSDYLRGPFPSGEVINTHYIDTNVIFLVQRKSFSIKFF